MFLSIRHRSVPVASAAALLALAVSARAELPREDVQRGARAAQACMACHSFTPGRHMTGPSLAGIRDSQTRADVIAYLEAVSRGTVAAPDRDLPDLKKADPNARVTAIRACGDGYRVTTADGQTEAFWEFNLRFKTDGSSLGPAPGRPVLIASGMQGDRAFVVFSRFEEIPDLVRRQCQ